MSRRRWIAGLAGLGLLAGVAFAPPSTATEAVFTDAEHATTPAMTALRLVPPQITKVTCPHPASVATGGTALAIEWQWPAAGVPYSNQPPPAAPWTVNGVMPGQTPTTTGPVGGTYTTSFTRGLLQGVVGTITSLLGGSFTVTTKTDWLVGGSNHWVSPSSSSVTVTYPVLGLGTTVCPATNGT